MLVLKYFRLFREIVKFGHFAKFWDEIKYLRDDLKVLDIR